VYKRRTVIITASELIIALMLKLLISDNLFVAVIYSFAVLSLMLIAGKVKNR
jgi:membrane protein putatively involved in post-translational modification of the autoinducing quorum-sensing peptide